MVHAWQLGHMPKPFSLSEHSIAARRASGAMDNASDYGSEDSRFDSWLARRFFSQISFYPFVFHGHHIIWLEKINPAINI